MKKIILTLIICLAARGLWAYTYVDGSNAPTIPLQGLQDTVVDIERLIDRNGKNFPAAMIMANSGGMPIGKATLGSFPHFYVGVGGALGCSNLKYYDEKIAREESVYPGYFMNPVITLGFGLGKGFDIMGKFMLFSDFIYTPSTGQKSAELSSVLLTSAGAKIRYNIIGKKELMPRIFDFAGLTIAAGFDYMEGDIGIHGKYKYTLNTVFLTTPAPGFYTLKLDAYYNMNLKWYMLSQNAHLTAYFDFLWIFTIYAGLGYTLNYGFVRLDGKGFGSVTDQSFVNRGNLVALTHNRFIPRLFAGIFTAGLEINIFFVKLDLETQVNISNGQDINLQIATRFQF